MLTWIIEYKWEIVFFIFFIWRFKEVWKDPIRGGNGVVEPNELATMIIIYLTVAVVWAHIKGVNISDNIVLYLVGSAAALAGVKQIPKLVDYYDERRENKRTRRRTNRRSNERYGDTGEDCRTEEGLGTEEDRLP